MGVGELTADSEGLIRLIETQPVINGRYRNIRRLDADAGQGAFSLVFTSDDDETGKRACLKVHKGGEEYRKDCFMRESRILERLQGQGDILPLIEGRSQFVITVELPTGEIPFTFDYFSTEVANSDVKAFIHGPERRPLSLLRVFSGICRGVQRLHNADICHRDIKPDNCLLGPRSATWLADFGTARILDGSEPALRPEYSDTMWRGDLRYTAPELICGLEDDRLFVKGDFYSLGAILFEMFTGSVLFGYIFDLAFTKDLARNFSLIQVPQRSEIFEELISTVIGAHPLPSIRQIPNRVPSVVAERIDRLYQNLCDLDHRRRLTNFSSIFAEINACSIILRRETQYRAWRASRGLVDAGGSMAS